MSPHVILASGSAIRKNILDNAGVTFQVVTSHTDEDAVKASRSDWTASALAGRLARDKALAVSALHTDAYVIGADQVLSLDGVLYDKARDKAEARKRLLAFKGKTHELHGGLAIARKGEIIWQHNEASSLTMREFSDAFLADYMKRAGDELTASVGCYAYEGLGAQLFSEVRGDFYAILGLPLMPLLDFLREDGVIET